MNAKHLTDLGFLSERESVLYVDPKLSNRVLNLGMTKQNRDRSDVARSFVNDGRLRSLRIVRSILL